MSEETGVEEEGGCGSHTRNVGGLAVVMVFPPAFGRRHGGVQRRRAGLEGCW